MPGNNPACHPPAKTPSIRSVNVIRTNGTLRITCVLVALLGWVTFSQRCAIWQLSQAKKAAQLQMDCCHKESPKPEKKPTDAPRIAECCKALHVLVPDGAKTPATPLADSLPFPAELLLAVLPPVVEDTAQTDTGPPPDVPAFAEIVLNRSLLSHAPPTLA